MFRNYFTIALRNIRQNPLYSFINIFSLAIGLAACMVIYLFIADEKSFDSFNTKKDRIYRVDEVQSFPGTNVQKVALTMAGMAPAFKADFPEVEHVTRFANGQKILVTKGDTRFLIPNISTVDSTFFDIFDYPVLHGDKNTALDEPYSIMVTESMALRFFKTTDEAMGNTLTIRSKEHKITGILKDVPEQSHLQFDGLISMATILANAPDFNDRWGSNGLNTYMLLYPNTDVAALEAKFPAFMTRHMPNNPTVNDAYKLFLQRIDQVHLASTDIEHDYNNYRKFNGAYLDLFYMVGAFILLIAAVNFMNLTTARASHRWKEIGVRKTVGAKRVQLFGQFIFESIVMAVMALVLAVLFDMAFLPLLDRLIGRQLSIINFFTQYQYVLIVIGGTLGLGLLTGIYPSFYLTSFSMSKALKGGKTEGKSIFRSSLVVVQFGLALAMIVSTLVVVQQLSYMRTADIGFDKDQMLLVDMNGDANKVFETLKQELAASPYVLGVTASGQRLGNNFHQWGFKIKYDSIRNITPSNVNVDYDYLKVYGIDMVEGRSFSKDVPTDAKKAFVINESFAKELGIKDIVGTPAGHSWYHNDSLGTIIGVVKDFNFNSLHYKVNTLSLVVHPEWGYDEMSVKLDKAHISEGIAFVKATWEKLVPAFPFDYAFLDEHFEVLYRSDEQMGSVVTIMAGLAILISCMGLFGLAAITTEKKTKEIGIRKALGASEGQITVLLSRKFALLIVVSFVIVSPLTWMLLSKWLEGFAYRIGINPLMFLLGGFVALAIAMGTISYHTVRSARANPVKALRYE
ncbi:MAG TPA: ABC transporter permease [Cyclobacteriaceae bacterium]|nr:ABC transporter permease [Cyclobacteriaceae bacterium]